MSREKDSKAKERPPKKWVWFLLGVGTTLIVVAGLWLGWVRPRANAELKAAVAKGDGLSVDVGHYQELWREAERDKDRYRTRYKKFRRRYKKLRRKHKRLMGPEGIEARKAMQALAQKGRAWGYISAQGRVVIPARYLGAARFSAGLAAVTVDGKQGYVDLAGKLVVPARYERADLFVPLTPTPGAGSGVVPKPVVRALAPVKLKGRYGVIDRQGRVVVKTHCRKVTIHPTGLVQCLLPRVKRKKTGRRWKRYELYTPDGKLVSRGRMHPLRRLADDRLAVRRGKRWGFVDTTGRWVIPAKYKKVRAFREGVSRVRTKAGWGFINPQGKLLGRGDWKKARDFSGGRAAVLAKGGWTFIDKTGGVAVKLRFTAVGRFGSGLAPVKQGGKWGYIDVKGRWVVKPRYKAAKAFSRGLAMVDEDERFYHCLTHKGTIAGRPGRIPPDAKAPRPFQQGGKWGYRAAGGKIVVAPEFQWAGRFYDGRARVRVGGKWGYVDPTGKRIIPATFGRAHAFSEGRAAVWVGPADTGAYALIDPAGKVVVPARYHWVGRFRGGFALASIEGADSLIDRHGKVYSLAFGGIGCSPATEPRNIGIEETKLMVGAWERPVPKNNAPKTAISSAVLPKAALQPKKKNGRYGYVNPKGVWVIPPTFQRAGPFHQGRAAVLLGRVK